MITVSVAINGHVIIARSARNVKDLKITKTSHICQYKVDDGSVIEHDRFDGAVVLAKKMLETVKEI